MLFQTTKYFYVEIDHVETAKSLTELAIQLNKEPSVATETRVRVLKSPYTVLFNNLFYIILN